MSLTTLPPDLPEEAMSDLQAAYAALENPSLAARLASVAGMPVEALRARLPAGVQGSVDGAVRTALAVAMSAALRSAPTLVPLPVPSSWFHRGLAAASGAMGGAFGLPGTMMELPVSTTILLRQIAAVAAEQGEDLDAPQAGAECMKVFAIGGTSPSDDAAESGYFAVRLALAEVDVAQRLILGDQAPLRADGFRQRVGYRVQHREHLQDARVDVPALHLGARRVDREELPLERRHLQFAVHLLGGVGDLLQRRRPERAAPGGTEDQVRGMRQLHCAPIESDDTRQHHPSALDERFLEELGVEECRGDLRIAIAEGDHQIFTFGCPVGPARLRLGDDVDERDVVAFLR